jgi:Zn-dependent protease
MEFDRNLILMIPVFLFSLSVHEFAHALTANWGGDMTATYEGRLTLNPIAHIDPIGTIVVPLMSALSNIPLFGWAKPVPVMESNFRKRNWDVVVALAGPGSNFMIVLVTAVVFKILVSLQINIPDGVQMLCILMIQINLLLMIFNLIPIPPLDGSHVLWHLVVKGRSHLYPAFYFLARVGIFFLLAIFWIPALAGVFGGVIRGLTRVIFNFILS